MSYQASNSSSFNQANLTNSLDVSSFIRNNNFNTLKNSFNENRSNQLKVASEILGLSSRKEIYQKPVPIDTINKFWGIDSKILQNDIIVQKQSFDQSYKNFWSFVDANLNDSMLIGLSNENVTIKKENGMINAKKENNKISTQSKQNFGELYGGKLSYAEARRRADEMVRMNAGKNVNKFK